MNDDTLNAMLDAAEADVNAEEEQFDGNDDEEELSFEEEGEGHGEEEAEEEGQVSDAPALKFTPLEDPKVDVQASAQERLKELQAKLDAAEDSDNLDEVKGILREMRDLTKSATVDTRLGAINDAFRQSFGDKYTLQDVFKSKEWRSFGETKRYGQTLQSLYAQAAMSGDVESITQIFEDFKVAAGAAPKPKPPVTPRASSAPTKRTASPRISVTKAEDRYVNAIEKLMAGQMTTKEFAPIEAAYKQAIGAR